MDVHCRRPFVIRSSSWPIKVSGHVTSPDSCVCLMAASVKYLAGTLYRFHLYAQGGPKNCTNTAFLMCLQNVSKNAISLPFMNYRLVDVIIIAFFCNFYWQVLQLGTLQSSSSNVRSSRSGANCRSVSLTAPSMSGVTGWNVSSSSKEDTLNTVSEWIWTICLYIANTSHGAVFLGHSVISQR